jgi:hypothetical protein
MIALLSFEPLHDNIVSVKHLRALLSVYDALAYSVPAIALYDQDKLGGYLYAMQPIGSNLIQLKLVRAQPSTVQQIKRRRIHLAFMHSIGKL